MDIKTSTTKAPVAKATEAAKPAATTAASSTSAAKPAAKPAAKKAPAKKAPAKKTAAKKPAAKKTAAKPAAKKAPAKKAPAKKTTAKRGRKPGSKNKVVESVQETIVQVDGVDIAVAETLVTRVKEAYKNSGHRIGNIKSLRIYINVNDRKAYYVINDKQDEQNVIDL